MEIARTTSSPINPRALASPVSVEGDQPATTVPDAAPTAVERDRVTISQEAQDKLNAETAAGTTPAPGAETEDSADALSGAKKFAYGALGLERPAPDTETAPEDSYTYGRWAAAAITAAAVVSMVV